MDLTLAEQNRLGQVIFVASDSNVAMQVQQPWMKFGTDAEGYDPDSAKIADASAVRTARTRASSAASCASSKCSRSRTRSAR